MEDSAGPLFIQGRRGPRLAVQLGAQDVNRPPRSLPKGGLRILFMAYSPRGIEPVLDFEGEEEMLYEGLESFVRTRRAQIQVVEDGSLRELGRRLLERRFDVLHLSGHGTLTPKGPRLLLEDELGCLDAISPAQLLRALERGKQMPELVMISSCHSADGLDGTPSFAAHLVAGGVRSVVGWVRPVRDDHATLAARDLYERLCTGATPAEALAFTRASLFRADAGSRVASHTWGTLQLLTREARGFRVDHSLPKLAPVDGHRERYRYLGEVGGMRVLERGFVGRRRPLQRLLRILRQGREGERTVAGAIVLGMKGVGKSCLVARAVDRYVEDRNDVGMVVVHGVLDEMSVLEAFRRLAVRRQDRDAERLIEAKGELVADRLERLLVGPWSSESLVIVLDDFERNLDRLDEGDWRLLPFAAAVLARLLPLARASEISVLITTTASFEPPTGEEHSLAEVRLGPFEPSSIKKLWTRSQGGALEGWHPSTWRSLTDRLGRNPRILAWARDLLRGEASDELRKVATKAKAELPDWTVGQAPDEEQQSELARLFLSHMAFERAERSISPDAREFVRRARVYEEPVPAAAFAEFVDGLDVDLDRHLPLLQNLGLLEAGALEGDRAYRVSPLVEPRFDAENPQRWHRAAAAHWVRAAETSDAGWRVSRVRQAWGHAVAGHVEDIADRMGAIIEVALASQGLYDQSRALAERHLEAFPESARGLLWAGDAIRRAGDPRRGWELYERGEALAMEGGVPEDARSGVLARGAHALAILGRFGEAETRLARAIALEERPDRSGSPAEAWCRHELAGVLHAQGNLAEAQAQLERSIKIKEALHGTDEHMSLHASLHLLAIVLHAQGDLGGARAHLERSLEIQHVVHGTNRHPEVASSLHQLGVVLHAQGDLNGARLHLQRSLEIKGTCFRTAEHPEVAASLHSLAIVLHAQGDLAGARAHLERSLEIKRAVLRTDDHQDVAVSLHALADVLRAQGDLAGAGMHFERSLAIQRAIYGTDQHPDVAVTLHDLAGVLHAQGNLIGARTKIERSLEIQRDVYGTDEHPFVAVSLHRLAGVLHAQGDPIGARTHLERALEIQRAVHGTEEHPHVASSLHELAAVLHTQGDFTGARVRLERSVEIQRALYGTDKHPGVAASLHELGAAFRAEGDLARAREHLERSLEIKLAVFLTDEHPEVAASLHALAGVRRALGDHDTAISLYRQALSIEERVFGSLDQYHSAETQYALGALFLELKRPKEAAPLLEHAYKTLEAQVPDHSLLQDLRPMFAGPDPGALARLAIDCRAKKRALSAELEAGLRALGRSGDPSDAVARFLEDLANPDRPLPELPTGLPPEARLFMSQTRLLAMVEEHLELAGATLAARASGTHLGEAHAAELEAMAQAGEPLATVASVLMAVAGGHPIPSLPAELREDARGFLERVLEAARGAEVNGG